MIEMWHGFTPEFWCRGTTSGSEVRKSSTSYRNLGHERDLFGQRVRRGALSLARSKSEAHTVLSAIATLNSPNQTVKAILRLDAKVLTEKDVQLEAAKATTLEVTLAGTAIPSGAVFAAEFSKLGPACSQGRPRSNSRCPSAVRTPASAA
jgi:hypothetical protein